MAAASSILVGLLLSSKTITDPSLNNDTGAATTTQVPWYLDLKNFAKYCPQGQCDSTPVGIVQGNFQKNGLQASTATLNNYKEEDFQKKNKECPGGQCSSVSVNALHKSVSNINTDCLRGRCDVSPLSLQQENFQTSIKGCKGVNCNKTPTTSKKGGPQNIHKDCPRGRCDVTATLQSLEHFRNLDKMCPGERCQFTTEGPTLGGFQGTADPFENYFVTENTLQYETDSHSSDPLIFSEPISILKSYPGSSIPNSFQKSEVSKYSPNAREVLTDVRSSASIDRPRNIVQVPSSSNIAPSQGFVYVDFGENNNGYAGDGSIRVVSQEIDNNRFQRESSLVDNDYDFWNSINGILGGELAFINTQTQKKTINNNNKNNKINFIPQVNLNTINPRPQIKGPKEARSFSSYPGPSVGAPSRGFITVDFGGNPEDWGPGGGIRVVSHE